MGLKRKVIDFIFGLVCVPAIIVLGAYFLAPYGLITVGIWRFFVFFVLLILMLKQRWIAIGTGVAIFLAACFFLYNWKVT